jgi:hypothetical protein
MYYSVSKSDSAELEVTAYLPPGIKISKNQYGYGIFAARDFKKGRIIYDGQFLLQDEGNYKIKVKLIDTKDSNNIQSYFQHSNTHAVSINDGRRKFYTYDFFTNHSCEPNSREFISHPDKNIYYQIALQDIKEGEEITIDYNLFEYECLDKDINYCYCKSTQCISVVHGFRFLSKEEKRKKIEIVDEGVFKLWYNEFCFLPGVSNLDSNKEAVLKMWR